MKKVVYSVKRRSKADLPRITGIGYIDTEDLVLARLSKNGNPYVQVFADCLKDCHPIPGKDLEYKGTYYEMREYEGHDVMVEYDLWYKIV